MEELNNTRAGTEICSLLTASLMWNHCCRHESQLWNLPNCGLRQACYLSELPSLTWPVLSSLEIMAIWKLYDYLKKIKI